MINVGILETGANRPEFLAEHGTFASWFERLFADLPLAFATYEAYLGQLPDAPDVCDAYLITGSAASVNDPDVWIAELADFVVGAVEQRPFVGVCFGHQLLHKIYGGSVEGVAQGWGIGVHDYQIRTRHGLVPEGRDHFAFRVSHSEHVATPARATTLIAASEFCPYAITLIGENMLTLQGHPELSPEFARAVYQKRRELIGGQKVDDAIATLGRSTDDAAFADVVYRFLEDRIARLAQAEG